MPQSQFYSPHSGIVCPRPVRFTPTLYHPTPQQASSSSSSQHHRTRRTPSLHHRRQSSGAASLSPTAGASTHGHARRRSSLSCRPGAITPSQGTGVKSPPLPSSTLVSLPNSDTSRQSDQVHDVVLDPPAPDHSESRITSLEQKRDDTSALVSSHSIHSPLLSADDPIHLELLSIFSSPPPAPTTSSTSATPSLPPISAPHTPSLLSPNPPQPSRTPIPAPSTLTSLTLFSPISRSHTRNPLPRHEHLDYLADRLVRQGWFDQSSASVVSEEGKEGGEVEKKSRRLSLVEMEILRERLEELAREFNMGQGKIGQKEEEQKKVEEVVEPQQLAQGKIEEQAVN